ncbi:MAG: hypothetical protein ACI4TR_05000, partial [Bacteroidaceae bacterium]
SLQEDLTNLIDLYTSNTEIEFIAGTAPGYYGAAEVEAYENALQNALAVAINPSLTDEEYQAAIDNLKQARLDVEASLVPITDGYYYMVNGFADFLDNFGVEKAAYIDPAVPNLKYRTFDPDNIDFVFNVTSNGTEYEYLVQSYANGYYVAKGTQWYNSNPAATIDPEEPQDIRLRYTGLWYWGSKTYHSTSYTPYASNAPTASDSEGNLTTWGVWKDEATTTYHSNLWYLRPISDEKMAEFAVQKEQADLDAALQNKVKEANDLYSKLFTIVPNFEAPLIKRASGGYNEEPAEDSQIRFSNIRGQGIETADRYEYLIDGDTVTYMQGTGYIALKLDEPHQYVSIVYSPRGGTANQHAWGLQERPKMVNIYGANTLEGDTVYGEPVIKGADMSEMVPHTIDLGRPVNRIAYQVTLNNNGGSYFTLSEFQLYDANVDQNLSQYYTVEGLKDKADALKALAVAKLAIAGEGKSTEADIEELQAAMSAVKSLYSDTTELVNLIAEAEEYIEKLPIGTDMGCVADQTSKDELQKAVDAARELGLKDNVTRDELTTAIANLTAAMKAFFANVKNIEEGKWYFVINADNTEGSLINGKALYRAGAAEDSPARIGKVTEGLPDYTYDPYSMWRFIAAEDGAYYVQNMGTGFYLPAGATSGSDVPQSLTKTTPYTVALAADGTFSFTALKSNNRGLQIGVDPANVDENTQFANAKFMTACAQTAWSLLEIDPEETQVIAIKDFKNNAMDIMALPYNYSGVSDLNEDCHVYGIKKMTYNEETDETTVEFYEKDEVAANEPAFFYFGNVENEYEDFELLLPFPTEVVDALVPANGIYGMLTSESIEEGVGYGSGKGLVVAGAGGTAISAHTGAIDPKYYK